MIQRSIPQVKAPSDDRRAGRRRAPAKGLGARGSCVRGSWARGSWVWGAALICGAALSASPAAAAFELQDGPISLAHLFAAVAGAVAVAAGLAATSLWRRGRAARRANAALRARLDADLSQERVFVIVEGRLEPASPTTEAFVRARFRQIEAEGAEATRAGALFDAETSQILAPKLRALASEGTGFEAEGRDYGGRALRVVGRSMGAKAVVRLWPMDALPARPAHEALATTAAAAQPAAEAALSDPMTLAFDLGPAGVALFDADGRLRAANAALARLWRLDRAWLAEKPTLRAMLNAARAHGRAPERAKMESWIAEVAADPVGKLDPEALWSLADGDALRVAPHALPDGGALLLVTDETDALGLERRYKAAVGAQMAALNAIDQGLALIGVDGRAALINPAFGRIWGLDLGDPRRGAPSLEGAPLAALAEFAGRDGRDAAAWERIRAAVEGRRDENGRATRQAESFAHRRANGRALSIQVSPQPDGGALIACADVTDTRRAEQALRERAAALEAADRLKSDFLNTAAGQLRTPVDTVITFAETLRDGSAGPLRKRQKEHLDDVLRAANDLREVVSDALALGALEGGAAAEIEEGPLDLRRTVASLATGMAARARRRGAELTAALPEEPLATLGDEGRLKQAISSAIATALSAAGEGDRMALRLSREDGADGPQARIEIALRRRAEAGIASVAAASGSPFASEAAAVAVSLARRIVEAHGGRLEFSEESGEPRAAFSLPIRSAPERAAAS